MNEEIIEATGHGFGVSMVTQSGAVVGLELLLEEEESSLSGEEDPE